MTEENDLKVSYEEVTRVSLECKCGAELVFDLNTPEHKDVTWDWRRKQLRCTVCERFFDSSILEGLQCLTGWFRCIDRAPKPDGRNAVFFRINRAGI